LGLKSVSGRTSGVISRWLPPVFWTALILLMSGDWGSSENTLGWVSRFLSWLPSLTPEQVNVIHDYFRKAAHLLTYGFLYVLWFRAFRGSLGYAPKKSFCWSLGLSLLVSFLDEGNQSLYQSRGGSLWDVGLDCSAMLLAAGLTAKFGPLWPRRGRAPAGSTPDAPGKCDNLCP